MLFVDQLASADPAGHKCNQAGHKAYARSANDAWKLGHCSRLFSERPTAAITILLLCTEPLLVKVGRVLNMSHAQSKAQDAKEQLATTPEKQQHLVSTLL